MKLRHVQSTIDWLLEPEQPSIRYFALRDIVGRSDNAKDIADARSKIAGSSIVNKIFRKLKSHGYWGDPDIPYLPKYKASFWQIMLLGYLGMAGDHPCVRAACEYIFRFQHPDGGFSPTTEKTARKDYNWFRRRGKAVLPFPRWFSHQVKTGQMPCLTGNMVAALARLGYGDDPRVKRAIQWLGQQQNQDGGWLCYRQKQKHAVHSCFYGTAGPLEGLSEYLQYNRSANARSISHAAAEFFLMHRLYRADHHGFRIIKPRMLTFTFPWFYGYNVLRGLDILTALGYTRDRRLNDAFRVVVGKQDKHGRWMLESTPTNRMFANIETKGRPSKWITLVALRICKRLGRL